MSCCNHFRDFLVLSSADLTRLTLVDAASCPAPGCQQITKHKIYCPPGRRRLTVKHCPEPEVGRGLFFFFARLLLLLQVVVVFVSIFFFLLVFSLLLFRTNAHTHTRTEQKTERRSNFLVCLDLLLSSFSSCFFSITPSAAMRCFPGPDPRVASVLAVPRKASENPEQTFPQRKRPLAQKETPFFHTQSPNDSSSTFSLSSIWNN